MEFINQKKSFYENLEFGETKEWRPSMLNIDTSELEHIMRLQSRKLIKLQLENNQFENNYIQDIYNKRKMKIDKIKEDTKEWIFITINPKSNITLTDFHNKIQSLTKWKCFHKGFYVLEQRGETPDNIHGIHAHIMLVKYNIERKRLIKRLETTFAKYCDLKKAENTINVKRKSPEHGKETLDEYMKGEKQDDKLQKVEIDKIWRKENNLDEIYFWDTTTDKSIPKKSTDGRVSNGGKREGAGRKKKEPEIEDKIKWGQKVTIDF